MSQQHELGEMARMDSPTQSEQLATASAVAPDADKRTTGLYAKFRVTRTDGTSAPGEKHDGCEYFVLDLDHDPYAYPAIQRYIGSCRRDCPQLADDLADKLLGKAFGGEPLRRGYPSVLMNVTATPNDWNPSEALFAFMGWLTCRREQSVFSATDDAAPVVELIRAFVERHNLEAPRDGWERLIVPQSALAKAEG